ncbi:MAG TPA: family 1 glycosylhydrolase [Dermatophilaceae bacterium]|nr:family 1 glycosylhydrolase [Dermatophilaceae bacterium]
MATLPQDFLFGTATASYQVEGAVTEGGRGRSVWDDFCDRPGAIRDGSSGTVACDHYHRYADDIALMKELGADAYRFSIAWPRIQPDGTGPANAEGLAFYDRLVDGLLEAGITPAATLFHWDLPSALEAGGGWLVRETALRFAEYAAIVAGHLGDRVRMWMPVNEPVIVTLLGYATGVHAPGRTLMLDAMPVAHHLLLGHGLAVQALRAAGAGSVGCAHNHTPVWPGSDDPADRGAADVYDVLHNRLFADPVLLGSYPSGMADGMPGPVAEDLAIISAPLDFFGFNYYRPTRVGAVDGPAARAAGGAGPADLELSGLPALPFAMLPIEGYPRTGFGWPVVPEGLHEQLLILRDRYGDRLPPVFVTENGCAHAGGPGPDGKVHDPERITYLESHLDAVARAREDGVDVRGYFCWSLLDNFEWAEGYTQRFGLVHVDYDTLRRTPKDSFAWFAQRIRETHRGG